MAADLQDQLEVLGTWLEEECDATLRSPSIPEDAGPDHVAVLREQEPRSASVPAFRHRPDVVVARRGRSAWPLVAAAAVLVALAGAGLFAWLATEDDGLDVITDPDTPERPEEPPETTEPPGSITTLEAARSGTDDGGWTQTDGITLDTVPFGLDRVITDGDAFYATSEGELFRSIDGIDWLPMTTMKFAFGSTVPNEATAFPAAAHDGTVVVVEGSLFSTFMVHVVSPDSTVASAEIDRAEEIVPSAAAGPQGILVIAGPNVHRSDDGSSWELVSNSVEVGSTVVATDGGFVLASPRETNGRGPFDLSFSQDGRVWERRNVTDAEGNARYTDFTGVSPYRGGAAAWTEDGVWFLDGDASGAGFFDYPEWEVPDNDPCCSARSLGLFGGGAGLAFVNGFVNQGGSLDPAANLVVGDGVSWTVVELPDVELDHVTSGIATTSEVILVVDRTTAWAASVIGLSSDGFRAPRPLEPAVVAAEQLAREYMSARDHGDGRTARSLFAGDAQIVDGFDVGDDRQSVEEHAQSLAFYAATEWRWTVESCAGSDGAEAIMVTCRYRHSNAWSQSVGATLEPDVSDGSMGVGEIEFEIVDGRIVRLDHSLIVFADEQPIDVSRIWSAFSDFVTASHPDDVATMFESSTAPNLTAESLALWAAHTDEFVGGT